MGLLGHRARSWPVLVLTTALAVLTACSSDGPSSTPTEHRSPSAAPTATTATGSPAPPPASTAAPRRIAFHDCASALRGRLGGLPNGMAFGCGTLAVPLDWARPTGGRTVGLAVVRIHRTSGGGRTGALLINPGGPGSSGVDFAVRVAGALSPALLGRFDLVGFDPRGVGASGGLRCITAPQKDHAVALDPDPRDAAGLAAQVSLARQIGQACARRYGNSLPLYGTVSAARDLDALRAALGERQLSYLGFSYGTRLGTVYATLFGSRVGALVLDGAVDPTAGMVAQSEEQARGFERAFTRFAGWCAGASNSCPAGPDARRTYTALLASTRAHPIPSSRPGDGRRATNGNVTYAAVSALYSRDRWPALAQALAAARNGDARGVLDLDDAYTDRTQAGTYDNSLDANIAVNCADDRARPTVAQVRALQAQWRARYPLFGGVLAVTLLTCVGWVPAPTALPTAHGPTAHQVLVVGTRNDPATPYQSAATLADRLGTARLLTAEGDGHTAYFSNRCVRADVDAYFSRRALPKPGTACPAG